MIIKSKNLKAGISGLCILTLFVFVSMSSCSTPSKKVDDSTDNIESSSTQITEQPADSSAASDNEHPADDAAGGEHPNDSEHPADSEHPNN